MDVQLVLVVTKIQDQKHLIYKIRLKYTPEMN